MKSIFRSSHPEVIAAWEAAQERHHAHLDAVRQQLDAWGVPGHEIMIRHGAWGGGDHLLGLHRGKGEDPPAGWRTLVKEPDLFVPDKRSAAGKQIAKEMAAVAAYPTVRSALPGMPSVVFQGNHSHVAGLVERDGVVWAQWGCDAAAETEENRHPKDRVDLAIWERVPLSAYYALVEAGSDPFAPAPPVPVGSPGKEGK